jgi:hypothetical protein
MTRISGSSIYFLRSAVFFIPPFPEGRRLKLNGKNPKSFLVSGLHPVKKRNEYYFLKAD